MKNDLNIKRFPYIRDVVNSPRRWWAKCYVDMAIVQFKFPMMKMVQWRRDLHMRVSVAVEPLWIKRSSSCIWRVRVLDFSLGERDFECGDDFLVLRDREIVYLLLSTLYFFFE